MWSFTGIRIDKVRLDEYLVRWITSLYELVLHETADGNVGINPSIPGLSRAVRLEHKSNRPRHHARVTVASVSHTTQKTIGCALLTRSGISKESRGRTQKPVVVKCLNDRDVFLLTYFVDGRGHHRKSIVNVNN